MGYYTTIEPYLFRFQDEEKKKEFLALSEEEKSIGGNPFYSNIECDGLDIILVEDTVKVYNWCTWATAFAKYFKGMLTFDGEEPYDFWRLEFEGDGTFKFYRGYITFKEEPKEIEDCKRILKEEEEEYEVE